MDIQSEKQKFGSRLRQLRAANDMTQEQLAEVLNKTVEHISYLERGERAPSFEMIFKIARAVDCSPAELLKDSQAVGIEIPTKSSELPAPAAESAPVLQQRLSDLERLETAFSGIKEMQALAHEYGINDILQDNGGKVLQVLIVLRLRISPGRVGNDAIDARAGNMS